MSHDIAHPPAAVHACREELHSLVATHSNRFTAGGPSAFDCAHGLRMNATGTAVVRGAATQRPNWSLSTAAGPLVEYHSVTGKPYAAATQLHVAYSNMIYRWRSHRVHCS